MYPRLLFYEALLDWILCFESSVEKLRTGSLYLLSSVLAEKRHDFDSAKCYLTTLLSNCQQIVWFGGWIVESCSM